MVRVLIVLAVLAVVFVIVSLVDCAMQPASRHRGVSKPLWIVIIAILPVIGGVLWFVIGRGNVAGEAQRAPDDDPEFLRRMAVPNDQDERIRRLEEELAQLDAEDADPRWGAHGARPATPPAAPNNTANTANTAKYNPDNAATPGKTNAAPTPGAKPDTEGDEHRGANG